MHWTPETGRLNVTGSKIITYKNIAPSNERQLASNTLKCVFEV